MVCIDGDDFRDRELSGVATRVERRPNSSRRGQITEFIRLAWGQGGHQILERMPAKVVQRFYLVHKQKQRDNHLRSPRSWMAVEAGPRLSENPSNSLSLPVVPRARVQEKRTRVGRMEGEDQMIPRCP